MSETRIHPTLKQKAQFKAAVTNQQCTFIINGTLSSIGVDANKVYHFWCERALKWLLNLLLSWGSCSCKRASELKKGITLAELCWSASVKAWQCFTITVLAREELVPVLVLSSFSISGGNPITTTTFISIRCRNESPKARLWTISRLSNTDVSTWGQYKNQLSWPQGTAV